MLPKENMRWNIRLTECLVDINNQYFIECIVKMLSTDNNDVFISCIDALRNIDIGLLDKNYVKGLKEKAELLLDESTFPVKNIGVIY